MRGGGGGEGEGTKPSLKLVAIQMCTFVLCICCMLDIFICCNYMGYLEVLYDYRTYIQCTCTVIMCLIQQYSIFTY